LVPDLGHVVGADPPCTDARMRAVEEEETSQPLCMSACEDLGNNGSYVVSNYPDWVEADGIEKSAKIVSQYRRGHFLGGTRIRLRRVAEASEVGGK
jgi:hypothetical protein